MNNLLSNLQQGLQQNTQQANQSNILQQQQINQSKINALLEQSAEALMCGPTCQKLKISEELKQKYLDAQTNMQTAPIKFEETKKNYYVYTEGLPAYNNIQEEELKQKAEKLAVLLGENFNEEITSARTMNTYYNTAIINSSYTQELLDEVTKQNIKLEKKLRKDHGDILTNDRKTYYETDALEQLKSWYTFWWYIFYLLVVVFLIAIIVTPSNLSLLKKSILFILLVFYPYYIDYIAKWVYNLFTSIRDSMPKSVYNNL